MKPTKIGSMWIGRNMTFIHGPRFQSPVGFKRIWTVGINPTKPRYVLGIKNDKRVTQSVIRQILPHEVETLKKLFKWDGEDWVSTFTISPILKFDGKPFKFYAFALDKKTMERFISFIPLKDYYRVTDRAVNGKTLYLIYRRGEENV